MTGDFTKKDADSLRRALDLWHRPVWVDPGASVFSAIRAETLGALDALEKAQLENAVLRNLTPQMLVLRELEWLPSPAPLPPEPRCPICRHSRIDGHDPFCRLAVALHSAEEQCD